MAQEVHHHWKHGPNDELSDASEAAMNCRPESFTGRRSGSEKKCMSMLCIVNTVKQVQVPGKQGKLLWFTMEMLLSSEAFHDELLTT